MDGWERNDVKKTIERNRERSMTNITQQTGSDKTAIRPFHVDVPDAELNSEEVRAGFRSLR